MAPKPETLTREEFASLLTVGNTCAVSDPPAAIPTEHSDRLIALGYMADLSGRLRMTTPGRQRIARDLKTGHYEIQTRSLGVETGHYPALCNVDLRGFAGRLSDRVSEQVPFDCEFVPFGFGQRIGRIAGALLALDGSQSVGATLSFHTATIHALRL
jgi:hypothetical protein